MIWLIPGTCWLWISHRVLQIVLALWNENHLEMSHTLSQVDSKVCFCWWVCRRSHFFHSLLMDMVLVQVEQVEIEGQRCSDIILWGYWHDSSESCAAVTWSAILTKWSMPIRHKRNVLEKLKPEGCNAGVTDRRTTLILLYMDQYTGSRHQQITLAFHICKVLVTGQMEYIITRDLGLARIGKFNIWTIAAVEGWIVKTHHESW